VAIGLVVQFLFVELIMVTHPGESDVNEASKTSRRTFMEASFRKLWGERLIRSPGIDVTDEVSGRYHE